MKIRLRDFIGSALAFILIVALTIVIIVYCPRRYQSRAKLLLRLGRESVTLDPTVTTTGETLSLYRTRANEINTTLDMMKNRQVLEELVQRLGADTILRGTLPSSTVKSKEGMLGRVLDPLKLLADIDPIEKEELVLLELESNLSIEAGSESGVVSVEYKTKSPDVAQQVVSTWIEVYRRLHASMNQTAGASAFFQTEERIARERLRDARQRLADAKDSAGLVTIAGQQQLLEKQLLTSREAVMQTESLLAASTTRLKSLTETNKNIPKRLLIQEASVGNRAHELMRDTLFQLEIAEKELESKVSPDHPQLKLIRSQRQKAEEILDAQDSRTSERTEELNPLSQVFQQHQLEEEANLVSLGNKLEIQLGQLAKVNDELVSLNRLEKEIVHLEGNVDAYAKHHQVLVEKYEQARLADALQADEITSINIVQPATYEDRPATPNKKLCAIVGFVAACCAAIGLQLIRRVKAELARPLLGPVEVVAKEKLSVHAVG